MASTSSGNRPVSPTPPPGPGASGPALFIDWGPPLPGSYGVPRITALVRDPQTFFVCWEDGDRLRVRDLSSGRAADQAVGRCGTWYFEGIPEHDYEIDLLSSGTVVAISGRIHLPRLDPAVDVDPEWAPTEGQEEILRGFLKTLEPFVRESGETGNYRSWRRRVAGLPVSRPSRNS